MPSERFRFRGTELRYNPKSIQVKRERKLIRLLSPVSGAVVQDMGFLPATVSGEGEFFGSNADSDYQNLRGLFETPGSGLLQIPGQPPFLAYFSSLGMAKHSGPEILHYSFSFTEDVSGEGFR